MSKFNTKTPSTKVKNHEGADAYSMSAEFELYALVVTTTLSDSFYEKARDTVTRIRTLVKKCSPEFVAKLAVYAREEMHLRSIPLVLTVELSDVHNGDDLVARTTERVIQRADELAEMFAYFAHSKNKPLNKIRKVSKQIEKGIAKAFLKFDEYAFAKYNRDNAVKLRDVLFKTHPTPVTDEQVELFKKIANDTLETPVTWETELSAKGNNKEVWESLIDSKAVGYMAMLRNLRNILEANVSGKHIDIVTNYLTYREAVMKSRQLPFRFLSAYKELQSVASPHTSNVLDAVDKAIITSVENVRGFDSNQTIAIACDVSGSMEAAISAKSSVQRYDIGLILGMILQSKCKSVVSMIFGDTAKIINLPKSSILQNVQELHRREGEVGYSTNGHLVIKELIDKKISADKVMMFTDCQMWNSYSTSDTMAKMWSAYKLLNPSAKLYLFDLAGYGTTPVSIQSGDVFLIAGWSDKVFDMLSAYEEGSDALKKINSIQI